MIRLFIAVPVPPEVKEKIAALVAEAGDFQNVADGIRPVPEENWHFTLVFFGYQPEETVPAIKKSITNILTSDVNNIYIQFDKLTYGPPPKGPLRGGYTPRMIWLTTTKETSAALGKIKNDLERELEKNGLMWRRENRPYQAHLTLARFLPQPAEDLPLLEKNLDIGYSTGEINLMKSTLKRTGAEYEILL